MFSRYCAEVNTSCFHCIEGPGVRSPVPAFTLLPISVINGLNILHSFSWIAPSSCTTISPRAKRQTSRSLSLTFRAGYSCSILVFLRQSSVGMVQRSAQLALHARRTRRSITGALLPISNIGSPATLPSLLSMFVSPCFQWSTAIPLDQSPTSSEDISLIHH